MDTNKPKKPWYREWWGMIIILLVLPFFLIWFVWKKTKWNKNLKGLATLGILIIFFALLGASSNTEQVAETKSALEKTNESLKQTNQELEKKIQQQIESTKEPTKIAQEKTWAEKLAQLDTNNPNPDKALVKGFTSILSRLSGNCGESEEWVADRIVSGRDKLKEYAIEASLMEVARGYDGITSEGDSCNEVFALYLTGRVRDE